MGRKGLMEKDLEGRIIEEDLGRLIFAKVMGEENLNIQRTASSAKSPSQVSSVTLKTKQLDLANENSSVVKGLAGFYIMARAAAKLQQPQKLSFPLIRFGSKQEREDTAEVQAHMSNVRCRRDYCGWVNFQCDYRLKKTVKIRN